MKLCCFKCDNSKVLTLSRSVAAKSLVDWSYRNLSHINIRALRHDNAATIMLLNYFICCLFIY